MSSKIYEEIVSQFRSIKADYISFFKSRSSSTKETYLPEVSNLQYVKTEIRESLEWKRAESLIGQIKICRELGMSKRATAKHLGKAKCTVGKYWDMDEPTITPLSHGNNYEAYIDEIVSACERSLSIRAIHHHIQQLGYRGNLSSFYEWFKKGFPSYKQVIKRGNIEFSQTEKLSATVELLSARKLSIHVSNPLWGVNKQTGECSHSFILAEQMISQSEVLQVLRESSVSFRKILNGSSKDDLMEWIEQYSQMPYQKIKSFVNGIVRDIKSVKNAIEYPWTNGTVDGVVNRIKVKKREMYGRAHFELLRRKVCLSISG